MSNRTPAGDKGTADRIEADDGGYWVRLVTKQALKREGECMVNCLRHGSYNGLAGEEDMLPASMDDTLWSLRKQCGTSYALAEVSCYGSLKVWRLGEMKGPHNTTPSRWSVRQVRHLRDAYRTAGADLRLNDEIGLVGLDGMTHRPEAAPVEVRQRYEEDIRRRLEERRERLSTPRFPSVHWMRNGRIEAGYLVVDMDGGTRQLVEVASHFANTPEPVADGSVDGFSLNDDAVTIRFLGGRHIRVPASGDTRLVTNDADDQPLLQSLHETVTMNVMARLAASLPGTPSFEMGRRGVVRWEDLVAEQAAERAEYERLGITVPPWQSPAIGVDTQPLAPDTPAQPDAAPASYAAYVEHTLRQVAASVDLPYEEFTRDLLGVSEASERARLAQRIRDRGLIISTPPMSRAASERFNAAIRAPERRPSFGLSTIPGLTVTTCGGGSSGDWPRATVTPRSLGDR